MESKTVEKLIIIGGGPAGYTAAIYAARAGLEPLVILGPEPGGQLTTTTAVENYPGFPEGVLGPELMELFRKQAIRFGAKIKEDVINSADFSSSPYKLTSQQEGYACHSLIISTGASPKTLGIPGEKEFWGKGISTCATCDGYFFKGKTVAVVGGGDSAMEEILELSRLAKKIIVIHRKGEFRASKIMQDRVLRLKNVEIMRNSVVEKISGENMVKSIFMKNLETQDAKNLDVDGVFIAIGRTPNTKFLEGKIEMDESGYIICSKNIFTSIEAVFAAGDVVDRKYRQAITASGMGCIAALEAQSFLKEKNLI